MKNKRKSRGFLVDFLIGLALIYLGVMVFLFIIQRSLMYFPEQTRPDRNLFNAQDMEIISVRTEDGLDLEGWYKAPADPEKPVIVMFHGNAIHIGARAYKARLYMNEGYGFLLAGYRGYGGNPGKPFEKGFYKDARAYLSWVTETQGFQQEDIILYGESLGTGIVIEMASGEFRDVRGLILESPYTSFLDLARRIYFYLPVRLLLRDRFDNLSKISDVKAPLVFLHGQRDMVVPYEQGRALYDAANQPKTFITINAAGHNDLYNSGRISEVLKALEKI